MKFEGDKGEHFFRSTLVQTLFYGVFSAWVLWARQKPPPTGRFEWQKAIWHLHVPFVSALFQQLAAPKQLAAARPRRAARLDGRHAQPRRSRGVPAEVQRRRRGAVLLRAVPGSLRPGAAQGAGRLVHAARDRHLHGGARRQGPAGRTWASPTAWPPTTSTCSTPAAAPAPTWWRSCGASTGRSTSKGLGDLQGQMVKKAALQRVLGFEIMPAPFVVAHLQVGLLLQQLGREPDEDHERASVYLTNALTGWEPDHHASRCRSPSWRRSARRPSRSSRRRRSS